jgi:integrase
MKITKYTDKNGNTLYKFNAYLGKDPLTGKEIRTNRHGFKSKKEAELTYMSLKIGLEKMNEKKKDPTFQDVYDNWIKQYVNTVRPSTYNTTVAIFNNHILPCFSEMKIKEITLKEVQQFVNSKNLVKIKEITNYAARVFEYARKYEIIDKNPCEFVTYPNIKKTTYTTSTITFLTKDELKHLLACAKEYFDPLWYTFFLLLAHTGLRRAETLALTWNDINFNKKTLTVNKALSQNLEGVYTVSYPKSKTSNRTISIDDILIKQLKKWKKLKYKDISNTTNKIFSYGDNDIYITRPLKKLKALIKKYNLKDMTIHDFRHTHASLLFEAGATVKDVQNRLGHSSYSVTMDIYTHITKDRENKTANIFENYMIS